MFLEMTRGDGADCCQRDGAGCSHSVDKSSRRQNSSVGTRPSHEDLIGGQYLRSMGCLDNIYIYVSYMLNIWGAFSGYAKSMGCLDIQNRMKIWKGQNGGWTLGCSILPQCWNFASKLGQPMRIPAIFVFNGNFIGEMAKF